MQPREVVYKFWVRYKQNPHYTGTFHQGLKPGIHGKFDTMIEAEEGAKKCRKWFNEERVAVMKPDPSQGGKTVEQVVPTMHDNVMTWIEEYRDGVLYVPEENKGKKEKAA